MKFSIIIPCYKVEQYLKQCVDSILCQTYKDIEVILVDDGSPDSCPAICDDYAKKDDRVRVIHKKNEGLSAARNDGLAIASGDYVCFVDSDDFIEGNESLSRMVSLITRNPSIDLLFFNVFYYDNKSGIKTYWPAFQKVAPNVCSSTEAIKLLVDSGTVPMAAWGKLIRKSLLTDNGIAFQSGIIGEDNPWFVYMMKYPKVITFLNDYIYAYRQNVSTSITKSNRPKHIKDMKYIIESVCGYLKGCNAEKRWIDCMYSFIAYNYCILLSQYIFVSEGNRQGYWEFMYKYKNLLDYTIHPKVKKVNRVYKILGLKPTAWILRFYLNHR